ncbi:MAG: saccharopine dehydrogenase NADP-binding domain-containing protein [Bacteroidetes bacterium]|nr:saccharopine dehydrogenase NADP-binding domain-containing protein [Bacteroidota bacterium]
MRNILLIGAGRSSSFLIKYFLDEAQQQDWKLTVADVSLSLAQSKTANHARSRAIAFDINNEVQRKEEIAGADMVISMLPANMHMQVAKECVELKKHLSTASYVSKEMQQLHVNAMKDGVALLNECGLDPGIDHMSAMKIIDKVKAEGSEISSFKSYCGGLVAPESNDNPWGYKFSWNPRNVILAGQGTAKFIENGKYRYLPYNRLFAESERVVVEGCGTFDGYANRDSLSYRPLYHLEKIPTMLRGTLRQSGYCKAWNVFVQLGLTDDSYTVDNSASLTYAQLVEAFLPADQKNGSLKSRLAAFMNVNENSEEIKMVEWTGILEIKPIDLERATPAMVLQQLLERKWMLKADDKDMIVMQHEFEIKNRNSEVSTVRSELVVTGEDSVFTAMAKTVGLPLAITSKLILNGDIKARGVLVPVTKEIYEPVLSELEKHNIVFSER